MTRDFVSRQSRPKGPASTPRNAAMDLLARREHSRLELLQKLARRFGDGESTDELEAAIATLATEGLQSDERFALSFTRERLHRGHGPRRVRAELQQRGVDDALIDTALAEVPVEEGTSWREQARLVLEKRFGQAPARDFPERARRLRFLDQRGFGSQHMPPNLSDD
ncbi:MAG: regulatory protein RecX [Halieaceae bacterium]|jgi:regulatory protein|nr:regulatory protein RecX [Halieaceae bacterium]